MKPLHHYITLIENINQDIKKEIFSIAKNGGYFNDSKQRTKIHNFSKNGIITFQTTQSFGLSKQANPTTHWTVYLDNDGINKIEKRTPTQTEIFFNRSKNTHQPAPSKINDPEFDKISRIGAEKYGLTKRLPK